MVLKQAAVLHLADQHPRRNADALARRARARGSRAEVNPQLSLNLIRDQKRGDANRFASDLLLRFVSESSSLTNSSELGRGGNGPFCGRP